MTGRVNADLMAVLTLDVRGENTAFVSVPAVVDTGYNGTLTLPPDLIAALSLPFFGSRAVFLADGSEAELNIYEAVVLWHGQERAVQILAADTGAAIGMALLYGSRLTMDILDGSPFTLAPAA